MAKTTTGKTARPLTADPMLSEANDPVAKKRARKPFEQLAENRQEFIQRVVQGEDWYEAYIASGYKQGQRARACARALYLELRKTIHEQCYIQLEGGAAPAIKIIAEIMKETSNSPSIRLKAATEILNRTGFHEKQEVTVRTKETSDMSNSEIKRELEEKLGPQALKVLQGGKA